MIRLLVLFLCSVASAHAATVNYTLESVILEDLQQITGEFQWDYTPGDFEGGTGTFTTLEIPWTSFYSFEFGNLVIEIETGAIEISGNGDWHDYGLDVSLKFLQPFTATQAAVVDIGESSFDCCGNGFHKQSFVSGSVAPAVVPLPAAAGLYLAALLSLGWCSKTRG